MPGWFLYTFLAIFFWGAWGLVSKIAADAVPALVNQILSTIGLLPPVIVALLQASRPLRIAGTSWGFAAGVAGALANLAFLTALSNGGQASIIVPLAALYPLVTILFAIIFLRERLNRFQAIGIALSLGAIVLLNAEGKPSSSNWWAPWFVLTVAALMGYGVSAFFQKVGADRASAEVTFAAFVLGFAPIGIVVLFVTPTAAFSHLTPRGWTYAILGGALNGLGVLATLIAYRSGGKASVVTPLAALYPIVTVVLAVIVLGEHFDTLRTTGVALALAAAVALSYEPAKEDATDSQP